MDTLTFWQSLPSHMDPVIFRIGSFQLQWYGLMYLVAFAVTYLLAKRRTREEPKRFPYDPEFLKNLMTWAFFGVLLGGRLGYVFFYNFEYYLAHPLEIILPFRSGPNGLQFTGISGMSYHGGLIGCFAACALYCRKPRNGQKPADLWNLCDLYFPAIPLGYTFGRIANFINGELWGRVTDSPIGMVFPAAPGTLPRHPSQLYEAFFEGIVLFLILWSLRKRKFPTGSFAGLYLIGYGFFRFFIEYFREPDAQLGLYWFGLFSQGQALCAAMILAGIALIAWRSRKAGARAAL
ncbi:MAG: lgt [Fibrobacteria bacterium]|jgi:phosphatidylglycerol:prolipoprotein diacylglycerol transferase|nr:lgt [Fibrobacteria bacterium]